MSDDTTASAGSVTSLTEPCATICNNSRQNATECDNLQQNATAVARAIADVNPDAQIACDVTVSLSCNKNPNSDLFTLSPQQELALDLLLRGIPTPRIAQHLGVHRATVHRWKMCHPRFIAELAHRARSSQFQTALPLTHNKDKTTIHLPQDQLWRDVIIPQ